MPLVRAYAMPAGWNDGYAEGHIRILYPNEARRIPYREEMEQFYDRIAFSRKHRTDRKFWNQLTMRWDYEIETPEEVWGRVFRENRIPDETHMEFFERFFTVGAAYNDRDDEMFLARISWNAETFADTSLRTALGRVDISMEEAVRLNMPRKLHMEHAGALRRSLRLSHDKSKVIVDEMVLADRLQREIGPGFDPIYRALIETVEQGVRHAPQERPQRRDRQPEHQDAQEGRAIAEAVGRHSPVQSG